MSHAIVALFIKDSSSYTCPTTKCSGLTEEEISYLVYGPDERYPYNLMYRWPRRDQYGDYQLDSNGDIIFDNEVRITRENEPPAQPVYSWQLNDEYDGIYCDHCTECLIEPFNVTCFECDKIVATGREAVEIDCKYKSSNIYCSECYEKHSRIVLSRLSDRLIAQGKREMGYRARATWGSVDEFREKLVEEMHEALQIGWSGRTGINTREHEDTLSLLDEILDEYLDFDFSEEVYVSSR
jgi:hypothetical protein